MPNVKLLQMKYFISFVLILCVVSTVSSGDYFLVISDTSNAPCASPIVSRESTNNPIRTSEEIQEDIYRYFRGDKPKLRIFVAAFGNAHIIFCSKKEKENIHKALLNVIHFDKI